MSSKAMFQSTCCQDAPSNVASKFLCQLRKCVCSRLLCFLPYVFTYTALPIHTQSLPPSPAGQKDYMRFAHVLIAYALKGQV